MLDWRPGCPKLALSLFWQVGLTAALTFLLVYLMMESLGWVIGAPMATERVPMVTVLAHGNITAAITGGGVMRLVLITKKE